MIVFLLMFNPSQGAAAAVFTAILTLALLSVCLSVHPSVSPSTRMCFSADEENESSSSEDEEDDRRRLNDELLGKVCSIESEEEPSNWYLALVKHTHTSTCLSHDHTSHL